MLQGWCKWHNAYLMYVFNVSLLQVCTDSFQKGCTARLKNCLIKKNSILSRNSAPIRTGWKKLRRAAIIDTEINCAAVQVVKLVEWSKLTPQVSIMATLRTCEKLSLQAYDKRKFCYLQQACHVSLHILHGKVATRFRADQINMY